MAGPKIIEVAGVSKRFTINREKSLKETLIRASRREKTSSEFWALKNIDLEIEANTSVGLMGANGSGKSTLLKIIGSIIAPSTGTVRHRGRMAAMLELGAGFHQDLTGRENIFLNASILGLTKAETRRHLDSIIAFSGIEKFIDTQVKFYSSGMYVRLAFAVAVHTDPDVLLVDEVLAVGDEPFQRKCMNKIAQFQTEGRSIVLVSHSADQVTSVCDRAVVLKHGEMVFNGDTRGALQNLRETFRDSVLSAAAQTGVSIGDKLRTSSARVLVGGEATRVVRYGQPLELDITVEPVGEPVAWSAEVSFASTTGHVVFKFDTSLLGGLHEPLTRARSMVLEIPHLALGEGNYLVNVKLSDAQGYTLDRHDALTTFDVEAPYPSTGYLGADPSLRFANPSEG